MRIPLAWRNLVHQKTRTLVAVAGVAFALILVFMQLGFYGAVQATATILYDKFEFDILIVSSQYLDIHRPRQFSNDRLYQARTTPGVERALSVGIGYQRWRNPDDPSRRRAIMLLAFDVGDPIWRYDQFDRADQVESVFLKLRNPESVIIDRRTRKDFGSQDVGIVSELGRTRAKIVGQVTIGTGFGADGLLLISHSMYRETLGIDSTKMVNLGLIQIAKGVDVDTVVADLRSRLPADVQILSRPELEARETHHWVSETSVGIIFTIGVVVAFIVGVVFVYQVIASDISNHLHEYATLKAVGYPNSYLTGVVLKQAVFLALMGYVPSVIVSLGLYSLTRSVAQIPIDMSVPIAALVLVLALAMCCFSGLLALRKAKSADPADLF